VAAAEAAAVAGAAAGAVAEAEVAAEVGVAAEASAFPLSADATGDTVDTSAIERRISARSAIWPRLQATIRCAGLPTHLILF